VGGRVYNMSILWQYLNNVVVLVVEDMLTGVPCLYSKWGEYIVKQQTNLPVVPHSSPLGIVGTCPTSGQLKGTIECLCVHCIHPFYRNGQCLV